MFRGSILLNLLGRSYSSLKIQLNQRKHCLPKPGLWPWQWFRVRNSTIFFILWYIKLIQFVVANESFETTHQVIWTIVKFFGKLLIKEKMTQERSCLISDLIISNSHQNSRVTSSCSSKLDDGQLSNGHVFVCSQQAFTATRSARVPDALARESGELLRESEFLIKNLCFWISKFR